MKNFTCRVFKRSIAGLVTGLAALFFNTASAQVVISEVNYHSDTTHLAGDWVELYNNGLTPVDISSWIFSDSSSMHFFTFPPATVLAPGNYLVLCNDTASFKTQYPSVSNHIGQFNFGLGNKGDMLRLFDSQSMLVFSMTYADSAGWPKAADGHGRTLECRNMSGNMNDPTNWYAGCMGGSPGAAPSPCTETIVFSEINYHSNTTNDVGDWVELRNIGSQATDISNWILRDKNDSASFYIQPGTVLQPGDNLVLSGRLANFAYWFPGATNVQGDFQFGLKNSHDVIRLFNAQGMLVYSLAYRSDGYWPTEPDGGGQTLELLDVNGIMNDGQNWFAGCMYGSPGRVYDPSCTPLLGVNEQAADNIQVTAYPNPFVSQTVIDINNASASGDIHVTITDALGREVMNRIADAKRSVTVDRGNLSPGVYFYTVKQNGGSIGTGKLVIEN